MNQLLFNNSRFSTLIRPITDQFRGLLKCFYKFHLWGHYSEKKAKLFIRKKLLELLLVNSQVK